MAVDSAAKLATSVSQKGRIVICATASIVLTAVGTCLILLLPAKYESTGSIWVQSKVPSGLDADGNAALYMPLTYFFNSPIATAAEVLKSRTVLDAAVVTLTKKLDGHSVPSVGDLKKQLSIGTVKDTDILTVTYKDKNPKITSVVVNTVIDAFIDINNTLSKRGATDSRNFLESEMTTLKNEYQSAHNELHSFQENQREIDLDTHGKNLLTRVESINEEIRADEVALTKAQAKVAYLRRKFGGDPSAASDLRIISTDPDIQNFVQQISTAQVKIAQLSARVQDSNPKLRELQDSLPPLRNLLKERVRQLVPGSNISVDEVLRLSREVQPSMLDELVASEAEMSSLQTAIATARSEAASASSEVASLPHLQRKASVLVHDEEASKEAIDEAQKKLRTAKLAERIAETASQLHVIERPQALGDQVSPNVPLYIAVLMFFASGLGGVLYFILLKLDMRLYSPGAILRQLPYPLVGWNTVDDGAAPAGRAQLKFRLASTVQNGFANAPVVVLGLAKSDSAAELACMLAEGLSESGEPVTLVDTNLPHPTLHERYNLPSSPGLADLGANASKETIAALARTVRPKLRLISAGTAANDAAPFFAQLDPNALLADSRTIIAAARPDEVPTFFSAIPGGAYILLVVDVGMITAPQLASVQTMLKLKSNPVAIWLYNCTTAGIADIMTQTVSSSSSEGAMEERAWSTGSSLVSP